jgi:hypothetical protein
MSRRAGMHGVEPHHALVKVVPRRANLSMLGVGTTQSGCSQDQHRLSGRPRWYGPQ